MSRRQGPGGAPAAPVRPRIEEVVRIGHEARQQARQQPQPQPQPQPPVAAPTAVITPKTAATGVWLADVFSRAESVQPFLEALAKFNKRDKEERRFGVYGRVLDYQRLPKDERQARRALQRWYHIYVEASPVAATLEIAKELVAELHAKVPEKFGPSWVAKRATPHIITAHVCRMLRDLGRHFNDGDTYTLAIPHTRTMYMYAVETAALYGVVAIVEGVTIPDKNEQTFQDYNIDDLYGTLRENVSQTVGEAAYEVMLKHVKAMVEAWMPALDWAVDYSRSRGDEETGWEDACPVDPTDKAQRELIVLLGDLFVHYYNTSVKECKPNREGKETYAKPVKWEVKWAVAEEGQETLVGAPPKVSLLEQGGGDGGCNLTQKEAGEV